MTKLKTRMTATNTKPKTTVRTPIGTISKSISENIL
jgi:hypothetical protein